MLLCFSTSVDVCIHTTTQSKYSDDFFLFSLSTATNSNHTLDTHSAVILLTYGNKVDIKILFASVVLLIIWTHNRFLYD